MYIVTLTGSGQISGYTTGTLTKYVTEFAEQDDMAFLDRSVFKTETEHEAFLKNYKSYGVDHQGSLFRLVK